MKKIYLLVLLLLSAALVTALTVEEKQRRIVERYSYELRNNYAWNEGEMKELQQHLDTQCNSLENRVMVMRHIMMREKYHRDQQYKANSNDLLDKTDMWLKRLHERKNEMKQLRKQMNANDKRERKKGSNNAGNGLMGE